MMFILTGLQDIYHIFLSEKYGSEFNKSEADVRSKNNFSGHKINGEKQDTS